MRQITQFFVMVVKCNCSLKKNYNIIEKTDLSSFLSSPLRRTGKYFVSFFQFVCNIQALKQVHFLLK